MISVDLENINQDFEFDHVGIAVHKIEEALGFYQALGLEKVSFEVVEKEKVKVALLLLKNHSKIELLESTDPQGPIARFIEKKGSGIHHICLRVKNLEKQLIDLKAKNFKLINETPRMGAHHCKVAFIQPQSTGGVLIELSEPLG